VRGNLGSDVWSSMGRRFKDIIGIIPEIVRRHEHPGSPVQIRLTAWPNLMFRLELVAVTSVSGDLQAPGRN
jgi:hypothetical protein